MKTVERIQRLDMLQKLIHDEKTGSPKDLACRLGVSKGTLYNLIEELESFGISISYSRIKQSYVYDNNALLEMRYSVKVITDNEELDKINGGTLLFSFRPFFWSEEC